ncbi:N-formylglutamate deformylase [Sphingopyxis flava]|uniref:Formiminoglutamase n=1 Tax=Sphingopyxis flava TaxID=1507287 RepID=A0A1T5BP24_9SPHN|nr:N-formylglutamate deformylase [Sphingopyxis flava]SKB48875.1 formiminoglutamase [Sphingopyxis flava]
MNGPRIRRGTEPLVVAFAHGGTDLAGLDDQFISPARALFDTDWWIEDLYAFAADMGATLIANDISRSIVDMNRDPSGASLYPGQATTELCPSTTFDGAPLHRFGVPDEAEITRRLQQYHRPYHEALSAELARLRDAHGRVVLYDAHSIRSRVPRLFEGELPQFNIGTNGGVTCAEELEAAIANICAASGKSHVVNGRFKGGWTTRHYGRPEDGVHAIQMELAMRGYMAEPEILSELDWPPPIDPHPPIRPVLRQLLAAALAFAKGRP